jgi:hypothetical protein
MKNLLILIIAFIFSTIAVSQELKPIKLLPPQTEKGKTLMKALEGRCSTREYSDRAIESPGYFERAVGS